MCKSLGMGAETCHPGDADEPMILRLEDCESLKLYPGLNPGDASDGAESDDTSAPSLSNYQSSLSQSVHNDSLECPHFELEAPMYVLMNGRSKAKAQSSLTCRPLASMRPASESAGISDMQLAPDATQSARTKLSAKAVSFRPLPFVPMTEVVAAWQDWSVARMAAQSTRGHLPRGPRVERSL